MPEKINGIVLNVRKYNERNCIVTLYTRERGKISFISPTGTGRASKVRRARLQPLSLIQTDLNFKPTAELQRLGSLFSPKMWSDIYFHPLKRTISLFISEFLSKLLTASMPDPPLYDFIVDSLRLLDAMDSGVNDFHIAFLISLLPFSGIQPDTDNYRRGYSFDFNAGAYVPDYKASPESLHGAEAKAVRLIASLNFNNIKRLRLDSSSRRRILYAILDYYSFHFPGLGSLRSPEILREIFS